MRDGQFTSHQIGVFNNFSSPPPRPHLSSPSSCQNSHFVLLLLADLGRKQQHIASKDRGRRVREEEERTECRYIFITYQLTSPFTPEQLIQFELVSQVVRAQVADSFD